MVSRLNKYEFFKRLKAEVNAFKPPNINAWDRWLNPRTSDDLEAWKLLVK